MRDDYALRFRRGARSEDNLQDVIASHRNRSAAQPVQDSCRCEILQI